MKRYHIIYIVIFIWGGGILFPLFVEGNIQNIRQFYVNPKYEIDGKNRETAIHLTSSTRTKIFVEQDYYDKLIERGKDVFLTNVSNLGVKFDSDIYLTEKRLFGDEWSPGIDNDHRITIYITEMRSDVDGYFREIDEYNIVNSNKREMIYVNAKYIGQGRAPAILAHEFQHLINFNQRKRLRVLDEEEWLNEALSEYAVTATGFSDAGDYLNRTARNFIANPTNALGIWESAAIDQASVSLFIHYLVGRYGESILKDIVQSKYVGEEAISFAIRKNGFNETFSDVFTDWTIALFLNSSDYKFQHSDLQYSLFHVMPQLSYSVGESGLGASFVVRDLAPEWHRFLPAKYTPQNPQALQITFSSRKDYYFRVPVVVTYLSGNIDVLEVEVKNGSGFIEIPDFTFQISSVVIIPASHTKLSDFSSIDPLRTFSYSVSVGASSGVIKNGDLVRLKGEPEIYIVKDGYRRWLQHSVFFDFYGHLRWENVKIVSQNILENYQEAKLIRRAGDSRVYEVIGFRKIRWLDMTAREFEDFGYDWEQVYEVNSIERGWYQII